jgi:hypothetical protein
VNNDGRACFSRDSRAGPLAAIRRSSSETLLHRGWTLRSPQRVFSPFLPLRVCIYKKYDFFQEETVGRFVLIDVVVALALSFLWYAFFVRYNRKRAGHVLQWVQEACLGKGRVVEMQWHHSSSRLKAKLRLSSRWF